MDFRNLIATIGGGLGLFLSVFFLGSCRNDKPKSTEILLSGVHKAVLLDSTDAAKAIVQDDLDKFFYASNVRWCGSPNEKKRTPQYVERRNGGEL